MRTGFGLSLMMIVATPAWTQAAAQLPAQAPADESDADSVARIVVTGEALAPSPGTEAYGSVLIPRERLTGNASARIENVLMDVAGFQQFRRSDSRSANPSAQGATLRALGGNASSRALVLLDGVPIADPFFGYIPFDAITPERLSTVRVTRGGGAGAFGAGAVAGTIEMSSATRAQLPHMAASAFYGSRDSSEVAATFAPDVGAGFVAVSGRWDKGDGFLTTPRSQRSAATVPAAYESWSTNFRAVAPIGADMEVQANALIFRDDRTLRFAGADSSSDGQDASIRLISRGRWQVDALAYVQSRDFSNIVISASTFRKSLDQRATPSTGVGGKIEVRPPLGESHVLRIGADSRIAQGDMFENAYNANLATNPLTSRRHAGGRQSLFGFFVEDDWTPGGDGGAVTLTGGVRADRWSIDNGFYRAANAAGVTTDSLSFADRSDWRVSGRAGAVWRLSDAIALRGAAYTGFRLPTLNELYRPFVVFPITTRANAALRPERLKGAEAGIELTPAEGMSIGATAFYNKLEDAIANVTLNPTTRERRNVDAIVAKGVELTASARTGAMLLSASYAYSHARVEAPGQAFDGLTPAQSPRHMASGTLAWAPQGGPMLSGTLRYVSRQYEDDLETDALPGAVTVDAFASLPLFAGITAVARAENLFDKTVVTRNAGGSMDLGTPRTLWLGIKVER